MALTYDGSNGLFTRLGALIFMMDAVRTHQTNLKTLLANVQDEYSSADAWMIDGLSGNIEGRISETGGVLNDVRAAAEKTLIEMCFAVAQTSTTNAMARKALTDALVWLIREMDADAEKINGTTISKSSLSVGGSNNGNGKFLYAFEAPNILLASTNDFPNIRTEMLEARCVQDAQNYSVARGAEVFEIRGQPSYSELDYRFPAGSGTLMRMSSISASVDNGNRFQNICSNTDLEDQTSNLPDLFSVVSGAAGTEFTTETTNIFRGTKALKLNVTGSVFRIRQQMGVSTGTLGRLTPDRPYVISFAAMKDAGATGTVVVSIQNAAGTILDSALFKNELSIAATTTSFQLYSAMIRSPRVIPQDTYIVIETTVAVAVSAFYIDEIVIAEMVPIASGGASLAIVAGSADWYADDNARYNFTNNGEGLISSALDRLFGMYHKGLSLPANYAGGETISDGLIA